LYPWQFIVLMMMDGIQEIILWEIALMSSRFCWFHETSPTRNSLLLLAVFDSKVLHVDKYWATFHMKKFVDICYILCSWQKWQLEQACPIHFYWKIIKNEIDYCVPPTSHPFGNFPGVICVEQLSASTMMLKEAQFTEIWRIKMA